jgi:ribonuclease BN (tRNA processing enzyme)
VLVRLTVVGCGDAVGSGGRSHTCFHVRTGRREFLIDCGGSAVNALKRLAIDINAIEAVFISHLHGDHFGGLPFLLIDARYIAHRTRPLVVAGPPTLERRIVQTIELMYPRSLEPPLPFELRFVEVPERERTSVEGIDVTAVEVPHPSGAPSYALRVAVGGKVVAYSGDCGWTDGLYEVSRGADLFICECYAYDREVPGHLTYGMVSSRREAFGCRRLVLTHLSDAMLRQAGRLEIEVLEDGQVIEV